MRRGADARLVPLLAHRCLRPGTTPPSFDKQPVRDYLDGLDWDKGRRRPPLPDEVVAATSSRYIEAYERITGRSFADWPGAGADAAKREDSTAHRRRDRSAHVIRPPVRVGPNGLARLGPGGRRRHRRRAALHHRRVRGGRPGRHRAALPMGRRRRADLRRQHNALLAGAGRDATGGARWSLSPVDLHASARHAAGAAVAQRIGAGLRAREHAPRPPVLAGCLRNASAVAHEVAESLPRGPVVVVGAGERWGGRRRARRPPGGVRPPAGRGGPVGRRRHPAGAAGAHGRGSGSRLAEARAAMAALRRGPRRPGGWLARLHVRSGARRPGSAPTWWRPPALDVEAIGTGPRSSSVPRRDRWAIYADPWHRGHLAELHGVLRAGRDPPARAAWPTRGRHHRAVAARRSGSRACPACGWARRSGSRSSPTTRRPPGPRSRTCASASSPTR